MCEVQGTCGEYASRHGRVQPPVITTEIRWWFRVVSSSSASQSSVIKPLQPQCPIFRDFVYINRLLHNVGVVCVTVQMAPPFLLASSLAKLPRVKKFLTIRMVSLQRSRCLLLILSLSRIPLTESLGRKISSEVKAEQP
jgi:hypothetical protein